MGLRVALLRLVTALLFLWRREFLNSGITVSSGVNNVPSGQPIFHHAVHESNKINQSLSQSIIW